MSAAIVPAATPVVEDGAPTTPQPLAVAIVDVASQQSQGTGALSQAIPKAPKPSPVKRGKRQATSGVDLTKWSTGKRELVAITNLHWDNEGLVGQTRKMNPDDVNRNVDSLESNPPDCPVMVTLWPNEGMLSLPPLCYHHYLQPCHVPPCSMISNTSDVVR
jgi:hypothetical protein